MNKKHSRFIVSLILIAIALMLLAGCGGGGSSSKTGAYFSISGNVNNIQIYDMGTGNVVKTTQPNISVSLSQGNYFFLVWRNTGGIVPTELCLTGAFSVTNNNETRVNGSCF